MNILVMTILSLVLMALTAINFLREWRQEQGFRHLTGTYFSTFLDRKNAAAKQRFYAKKQDKNTLDKLKGKLSVGLILEHREILQPIAEKMTQEILYRDASNSYIDPGILKALWDEILSQYAAKLALKKAPQNINDFTALEFHDPLLRALFYRLFKASQDDFETLFSVKKHKINIYEAPSKLLQHLFPRELCISMVQERNECHQRLKGCSTDEKKAIYNEYRKSLKALIHEHTECSELSPLFDLSIPSEGENAPPE